MPFTALLLESKLLREIAPNNVPLFYQRLTEADLKLLEAGDWQWTRKPLDLTPDEDGVVVLPDGYVSIVGCRIGSMAKGVLWQEVEYVEGGPGQIPIQGTNGQLIDQGVDDAGVRSYRCTGSEPEEIVVLARLAPVEITLPSDIPLCQSFPALKQAMLSVIYENANDAARAQGYLELAIATLDRQEKAYRGVAKKVFDARIYGSPRRRSATNFP